VGDIAVPVGRIRKDAGCSRAGRAEILLRRLATGILPSIRLERIAIVAAGPVANFILAILCIRHCLFTEYLSQSVKSAFLLPLQLLINLVCVTAT
jgi:hypothetical protein